VILGAGPVGQELAKRLVSDGREVRIVNRSSFSSLDGTESMVADIADPSNAKRALTGSRRVYLCVGMPYPRWEHEWVPLYQSLMKAVEDAGAPLIIMDNVYMYGPSSGPMSEATPLTDYGKKPALRAKLTRMWQDAHTSGKIRAASVRASDFYGPGVKNSALGEILFGNLLKGKAVQALGDPTQPHSITYVPDVARALLDVAENEDTWGEAWNVPNATTLSIKQFAEIAAKMASKPLKIQSAGAFLLTLAGIGNPNMRELKEMHYQWTSPFVVDDAKFRRRFGWEPTPFEVGIAETLKFYETLNAAA
jgi:nucleoside-diphosphate-sugar epimerase